jgi:hypothetical protein
MTQPRSPKDILDEDEFPRLAKPNQPANLQDEREWTKRRELLQSVLRYLNERGPTNWATLYVHFNQDGTGEIGSALGHLAVCKHVVVESTIMRITARGMEQLQSGK